MTQRRDLMNNEHAFGWLAEPERIDFFEEEIAVDLLIIGGGHAGIAAARSAIEENGDLNIMVIDQQSEDKFKVLGTGEIGHINSKWRSQQGFDPVDVEAFANDWQLRSNNRSNYSLIRKYADNCGETFDWIIDVLDGEELSQIKPMLKEEKSGCKCYNSICSWAGSAKMPELILRSMMTKNRVLAAHMGVRFMYDAKAYKLLTHDGQVNGAVIEKDDGYMKVMTKQGVLLAAGDYSRNRQMCRDLLTEASDMIDQDTNWTGQGWEGDGLRLGMLAGGRMEPRSHGAVGGNYAFPGFEVIGTTPVLRVNSHGKRYSNEGYGTHVLAAIPGAKQPNGMMYGVFDSTIRHQVKDQVNSYALFDYTSPDKMSKLEYDLNRADQAGPEGVPVSVRSGKESFKHPRILYSAKSLETLAEYMYQDEVDRENFLESVKRYNELCRSGIDKDFGKDRTMLHPIEKGPFYAAGQVKDSHHPIGQGYKILITVGGLLTDEKQQVLDDDYEPIPGLYATGNSCGGRFGSQYTTSLSGQSISMAHTLGREVGRCIARLG